MTDKKNVGNSDLNRRKFLEYFAALGISSTILPSCSIAAYQDENIITTEMIESAEKIIGLELTQEERTEIAEGLNNNLEAYRTIRKQKMEYHVNPSMVFNPIPPTMEISRIKKPAKFSKIQLRKPENIEDCAAVFHAIYGPDGKDNSIIDYPFNWDADFDIRNVRLGYHSKFFEKELMGNPNSNRQINYRKAIRRESKKVLDFYRGLGFTLIPLDFEMPHAGEGFMMEVEAATAADEFTRSNSDDLVEDQKWPRYHRTHRFVPAVEYLQASRYRSMIIQKMDEALKDVDVYIEITWSTNWSTNVTGHPIVVVPCGFVSENRPISITFVGKLFQEANLLAVAKAFQDATNHHLRYPTL